MSESEPVRQSSNIVPPRRGAIIALAVDSTARAYDFSALLMGGDDANSNGGRSHIYVTFHAQGNDIFYFFNSATASDLNDTTVISAGGAIAYNNAYGARLAQNDTIHVRIDRGQDKFLIIKTASGTATLRFWPSSQPTP